MISKKIEKEINEQINAEFWSAYFYLSMSAYFISKNLPGFANWMRVQYQEEISHALKFFNYLNERGGRVILTPIKEVKSEWKDEIEVFKDTLKHEQHVTSLISNLINSAIEESDGKWKPSPGLIYPLLGRLLDEGLIEETEDGKYQITDEGKTISKDLEVFNRNMKEQIDTVMKMANVGKFMAMDVLERVTILGNLLSSNVSNMTNHEVEKYKKFLKSELEKIKEMDSKK